MGVGTRVKPTMSQLGTTCTSSAVGNDAALVIRRPLGFARILPSPSVSFLSCPPMSASLSASVFVAVGSSTVCDERCNSSPGNWTPLLECHARCPCISTRPYHSRSRLHALVRYLPKCCSADGMKRCTTRRIPWHPLAERHRALLLRRVNSYRVMVCPTFFDYMLSKGRPLGFTIRPVACRQI